MKSIHRLRHKEPSNEQGKKETPFFSKPNSFAVQAKEETPFFQAKLAIGKPGDPYEREADAVADAVVSGETQTPIVQKRPISSIQRATLATPAEDEKLSTAEARMEKDKLIQEKPEIQRMDAQEEEEPVQMMSAEEEEPVQMQAAEEEEPVQMMSAEEEEEPVQMQAEEEEEPVQAKHHSDASPQTASSGLTQQLQSSQGNGKPLPPKTRAEMETAFGVDFKGVNIHTDAQSIQMNRELGAQAFTHGSDVYFNTGKFSPETNGGKHLLAHELTHVVQQNGHDNIINRSCGDDAVDWYNPFIRIASYEPSCQIQYANMDWTNLQDGTTDWRRNAVDTGLLSAVAGLATTVIGRRLGLNQLASSLLGASSAFARGYVGLTVKERIRGYIVKMHNWYGRYKYNVLTGQLEAVDFQGVGDDTFSLVTPWYYEQAIFDAEGNMLGGIYENLMEFPGIPFGRGETLPERSYGEF